MHLRGKLFYTAFSFVAFLIIGIFAVWWFDPVHIPHNFDGYGRVCDVMLFMMASYVVWHPIIMEILCWVVASHIKQDAPKAKPKPGLRVAFLTTFVPASESIDLLYKTLPAMTAAAYAHDTWVLDEGNDPEVKRLCATWGVKHFSRYGKTHYNEQTGKFATKTKGGNHNSWYDAHGADYDIVAQLDTDFVPRADFLEKTLGYFTDPRVAFVGTPQIYGNVSDSFIARGAAEQTYSFYGPFLRGLHGMGATLLIGANHVIRVEALKSVNHYSAHITEDLLTGMKLHEKGWKSVYVHEPLAIGEGPSTWEAYFNQQMRWAYGCIDILFHHSPGLFRRMNFRRAIYYYFLQQHYFTGLAMIAGMIGLLLYFLLGIYMAHFDTWQFLVCYLPAILACGFMGLWLQRFNVRPQQERGLLPAGKVISMAAWPIFFIAFVSVLGGKRLSYKVTPKGNKRFRGSQRGLHVFTPHLLIGVVNIAMIGSSFFTGRRSWLMLAWAGVSALFMLGLPCIALRFK